jgi:hypothetical protein
MIAEEPFNPFEVRSVGREALAEVLLDIRAQAGTTNWDAFAEVALREAGLLLPVKSLETYAPRPRYSTAPPQGLFYALEAWSQVRPQPFLFSGGEPISAIALYEVLLERRAPSGRLL